VVTRPYLTGEAADRWVGVAPPPAPEPPAGSATLDQAGLLADVVEGQEPRPVYLSGVVEPAADATGSQVAVVVNGTVASVVSLFDWDGVEDRYATMIAPELLRPGVNEVDLYLVDGGSFAPLALT